MNFHFYGNYCCSSRNGTCVVASMYVYVQIFIPKFVFSMFVAQMIHEDGGSRSKGSPAGMTIDNSLL